MEIQRLMGFTSLLSWQQNASKSG